jgi:hypothetical protein
MFGFLNSCPSFPDPSAYMPVIQAPPEREWEVWGCTGIERYKGTDVLVNASGGLEIRSWGSGLIAAYSPGSYSRVVLVKPISN